MQDNYREPRIDNSVTAARKRAGMSASALAESVGISRQAIYAIEAGTYVPNTAVTLRLAKALDTTVEELFRLRGDTGEPPLRLRKATLISADGKVFDGEPVQLGLVDGRLMAAPPPPLDWFLPPSDGIVTRESGPSIKVGVRTHGNREQFENRLLIAGCDPAMTILSRHLRAAGIEPVLVHRNSSQALALLENCGIHVAGTHLPHEAMDRSYRGVAAISLAKWQEGLVVARGNPKQIRSVEDLARRDIRFLNREPGSGSRALVETHLKRAGLSGRRIRGYNREAPGHLAAAVEVKAGIADCCIAIECAARRFGLSFVPLETVSYDLVVRNIHLRTPVVQKLLDTITLANFRRELSSAAGYDTTVAGKRLRGDG